VRPTSQTTVAEHTARWLTQHFAATSPGPIVLSEERPVELGSARGGRYLTYDFHVPLHRELTFRVLVRGEVKITVNGEAALDFRQPHLPGKEPPEGWHEGWHQVVVWPDRFINGWVRVGVENPMVESSELVIENAWACSGAAMTWQPPDTPLAEARQVDSALVPDGRLSDPAWENSPALGLRRASLVDYEVPSDLRFLFDEETLYIGFTGQGAPLGHAPTGDTAEEEKRLAEEANADEGHRATLEGQKPIPGSHELYRPDVMSREYLSVVIDAGTDGSELVEFLVNCINERDSTRYTRSAEQAFWSGSTRENEEARPAGLKGSGFWNIDDFDTSTWRCWTEVDDKGWSACIAIPYSLLGARPELGDIWRFNACRQTHGDRALRYLASPHPDMYHDSTRFAQLLFGSSVVAPISADLGRRVPGKRVAEVKVRLDQDAPRGVSGTMQFGDYDPAVSSRETLNLVPGTVGTLSFDLDVGERPNGRLAIALTDANGEGLYRSEPIDVRVRAITGDAEDHSSAEIRLTCNRREHEAFQIGIVPKGGTLENIRLEPSDLTGPDGATIAADSVEWFVVGRVHREPKAAYMVRREVPNHTVRWVPDVLVPVDSFAIEGGEPTAVWVEVTVPAEARLGRYGGQVIVHVDSLEPRVVTVELLVPGYAGGHDPEGVLDIGTTKQLLIDDYIVGDVEGGAITYHSFEKHPRNPLILPDGPADLSLVNLYGTILERTGGGLRMWYTSHSMGDYGGRYHVLYAESDDGLAWAKPDLGAIEFDGSVHNNLVDFGTGSHIIHRPEIPDPARRYVRYVQYATQGTFASYSPDGINWQRDTNPLFVGSDAASPTYDPRTQRYHVVTIEDRAIGAFVRRSPAFSTSEDGIEWSQFRPALWADARDDRNAFRNLTRVREVLSYDYPDHFHSEFNDVKPYPYAGLYLATVTMFECSGADIYKGTPGGRDSGKDDCATHLQLASSRSSDLSEWQRAGPRDPLIDRGADGEWDSAFISASDFPVEVGNELWLYYGGFAHTQQHQCCQVFAGSAMKRGDVATGIGVATMRLDGFVSLDSVASPARLTTKPLRFSGERLEVNAAVRGSLRFAVLDEEGHALPGLGESDCEPLEGDSVRHVARWQDESRLRQLAGLPVRLAFHLQDAELYAFQFMT